MNELNEKQAKIQQAIDGHIEAKAALDVCISEKMARLEKVKREIAEEAKPKLRHGDYGEWFGPNKNSFILDLSEATNNEYYGLWRVEDGDIGTRIGHSEANFSKSTILGNIFDDLKALQEDVTEFEIDAGANQFATKASFFPNHVNIADEGGEVAINYRNLSTFILKLRQMEATLKRRQE